MLKFAVNAAMGAAAMYALDPDHGRRRRQDLRRRWRARSSVRPTVDRPWAPTPRADSSLTAAVAPDAAPAGDTTPGPNDIDPRPEDTDPRPEGLTLTDVLQDFSASGFTGEFEVDDENGSVLCLRCSAVHRPDELSISSTHRLEGVSDPADMAIVLGARCPSCDQQGVVICRYGPEASAGDAELLRVASDAGGGA